MKFFITLVLINNFLSFITCSECNSRKTCGDCIGYAYERCVWCAQENKPVDVRCQPASIENIEKWCDPSFIYNPEPKLTSVNASFASNLGKEIQFRPQKLHIKVRPGIPVPFDMSYKPSVDFPLDVYFLMDYSFTMRSYKEELKQQALIIYSELEKMTKNVLLGVGSFIEKPALPYAKSTLALTYSFRNHLSLTKDMKHFQEVIHSSTFGGNLDDPEAGLDALMQVMTCVEEIGWRNNSRRIIVLATDSTYHSAGDGKMVGAYKPNDMKCHLKNNEYEKNASLLYDYPSVSQINTMASKGNFKIIFAAVANVMQEYSALANHILNAKYAQLNSNNIVPIIKRAYEESVKSVKLNYELPPFVHLKINQDCDSIPKLNCESVPSRQQVDIPATLKVMDCISENSSVKNFWIKPIGINDELTIHLEIDCSCSCEKQNKRVDKSCSSAGIKKCGVCVCDKNRSGDKCQYECSDENARKFSENCKQNKDDKNLCSGHGTCRCGKCEKCAKGYSGDFCQYSDDQCPQSNGFICADKGDCRFNKCECRKGWSGEACTCSDEIKGCISPFSSKICSGRGICKCGECICNTVSGKTENYTGVFCDNCAECAKETCENLAPYAICNYDHEKSQCDRDFNQTNEIIVFKVNKTEIDSPKWGPTHKCISEMGIWKNLKFKYNIIEETKRVRLLIQTELEEIPKANIWIAAGSTIGAVVLIGLITGIVWKILIDLYDKREYEKFCNEAKGDGYDVSENPLYRVPEANFINPAYNYSVN